eukprot:m51a1_g2328 hypothetical protein (221) ;mRNA; f:513217-513879
MVSEDVELVPEFASGRITPDLISAIQDQALERLAARDPLLRHVLEVKVVCNQRRNFINFTVRREYSTLCHVDELHGVHFCYFVSDKLEPFVIVTALEPRQGRLQRLTRAQAEDLATSLASFRQRFGLVNETYHYTPLDERKETDRFVRSGVPPPGSKAHSSHFHLKIRVATQMVIDHMPALKLVNLQALRTGLEPVKYNFERKTLPWDEVYQQILRDANA